MDGDWVSGCDISVNGRLEDLGVINGSDDGRANTSGGEELGGVD